MGSGGALYAKERRTFGKPIAEHQAIQLMLADMETEIEAARALTHFAAFVRDKEICEQAAALSPGASSGAGPARQRSRLGPAASRAKLYASEMANRVAYKAVQIHGSAGYSRESEVASDSIATRACSRFTKGTSEMQRTA